MDIDQKRVQSIFLAAVENHAPEQWAEFLGETCRDAPEVRRRVESLLRGHVQPNVLLDQVSAAPVPPVIATIGEGPGAIIGPYKLLEQIGDGGFGVVFMAEQQHPVRRKVALKIIKPGMDSRQVIARFEAERQALALMDHPNIAQVFDGGATDSGRPFFVMELIRGIPITDYCDRNHLGVRERLELFMVVCMAVQHAHQKGIIHRDLKPSNVMVTQHDVTPVVKIIDFGIAKATGQQLTDKTLFTNFAQMIGTPMYMSPEQAQMSGLDVDTRSDVYSLGVLLYELLTGKTPFDRERLRTVAYDEMIRIIREEEPVRPSTRISTLGDAGNTALIERYSTPQKLSQLLRGELDWIVMKALEKDRNRRFESASALADDVRRYLDGQLVLACPPTLSYRFRKFARQHKAALATATIVVAALAAGTGLAIWQAVVATQAKLDAQASAANEKKAKLAAETKEAEARAVVDFLENRVLAAARPEGQSGGLGHDVSLQRAIEAAVPFVQDGFKDQPLIEARLRMTLGSSFRYLGDSQKSNEQFAAAMELYTRHLGPDHALTLESSLWRAATLNDIDRFAEACQLGEAVLTRMEAVLGVEHRDSINAMDSLGCSYAGLGRHDRALDMRERAVQLRKATVGPEHPWTLNSLLNLAVTYSDLGRHAEALNVAQSVLSLRKANLGADHPDTVNAMTFVATCHKALGNTLEACRVGEEVLALRRRKLGIDHPLTLESTISLAGVYGALNRPADALRLNEEVLKLRKSKLGVGHRDTLRAMLRVADGWKSAGRDAEAVALLEETWQLQKDKLGLDHPDIPFTMNNLAWSYHRVGRHADALRLGKQVLAHRVTTLGVDHTSTLMSRKNVGDYHSALGQHAEALAVHEENLSLRTAKLGEKHPDTIESLANVARSLVLLDRGAEALSKIDDGIQRAKSVDANAYVVFLMGLRFQYYIKVKDPAGCRAAAAALDTLDRTDANGLYETASAHAVVADLIRKQDQSVDGEKLADAEADRAMVWLRKAVAAGFRDAEHATKDRDLDVLRKRPDFVRWLAELRATPAGK